jgi:hypothetical protein
MDDDDDGSPQATARKYRDQGLSPGEIRQKLVIGGLDPRSAAAAIASLDEGEEEAVAVDLPAPAEPVAAQAVQPRAQPLPAGGIGGGVWLGLLIMGVGIAITVASDGHVIAYGAIVVGAIRVVRSLATGR